MTSTISTTDQSTGGTSADSNERLLQQIENLDLQSSQNNNSHNGGGTTTSSVATADLLDMLEQDMSNKATKRNNIDSKGRREYSSGEDLTNSNNQRRPATRRYSGYNSGDSSIEGSFTSKLLGGYTDLIDDNSDNDDNINYGGSGDNNSGDNYNNEGEEMADTHVTEEEEFIPSIDDSAIKKTASNYAASNNYAPSTNYAASNSSGKSSSDNSYPQTNSYPQVYTTPTKTQDGSGSGSSANINRSNNSPYHSSDNSSNKMAPLGKLLLFYLFCNCFDVGRVIVWGNSFLYA